MKIIEFLSENLYYSVIILVVIALVIFYFIGRKKKEELETQREENIKESEIDAPISKKRFIQGYKVKEQEFKDK